MPLLTNSLTLGRFAGKSRPLEWFALVRTGLFLLFFSKLFFLVWVRSG